MADTERAARRLALAQAAYFGATGIWPLVHMRSFEAVTGPKADRWLVQALGGLISAVSLSLAIAARRNAKQPETIALAAGSAFTLGAIDVVYVAKGAIPPIYLLDAVAETALLVAWARQSGRWPSTRETQPVAIR